MGETKDIAEKMKCMDLAGQLGQVLGMNPVWKDDCVIYGGNLHDPYIMLMRLDDGRWEALTKIGRVLNLPQEVTELMAKMSKLAKGENEDDEMDRGH